MTVANVCFPYLDIAVTLVLLRVFGTLTIDLLLLSTSLAALLVGVPLFALILRELGPRPHSMCGATWRWTSGAEHRSCSTTSSISCSPPATGT